MATIKQAAEATDIVVDGFNNAQAALRTCFVNGLGVLCDPSAVRRDLLEARGAINEALAALNAVESWPGEEAYERAQRGEYQLR
jgi:hypothetical protein